MRKYSEKWQVLLRHHEAVLAGVTFGMKEATVSWELGQSVSWLSPILYSQVVTKRRATDFPNVII